MLLRRRAAPAGPAPADRVQALLAPTQRGWVPPPEPGDAVGETGPEPLPDADAAEPVERSWARYGAATGVVAQAGPVAPGVVADRGPDLDDDVVARPARPPGAHAARALVRATAAERHGGLRTPLLHARLDPSRRAATALVVVALLAAVVTGVVVQRGRPQEVVLPEVVASGVPLPGVRDAAGAPVAAGATTAPAEPGGEVVVAVAGKVRRPGLVRLPTGSRVDDAVRAAGGPLPGTSPGLLNLARRLVDGEQVLVGVDPPPSAATGAAGSAGAGTAAAGPVDLNAAGVGDLDALPGIGPVLAQRIVDWRTEHGRFASVEQLREVTGIGESKYDDLRDKVTVS